MRDFRGGILQLMIGTMLGRFRILESIGSGGMGRVYLAEDPLLGRKLAVKVLPPDVTHDPERRERLLHEARAASALNHPNIVVVHDLAESDGILYLAMELIDGVTVRQWGRERPRSPVEIVRLLRQATAALQVAHGAGLVHRDLKPENMLVRRDGLLKILDFGLARSLTPSEGRTETLPGTVLGTAPYMSPEQVLGQPAGPASDLFSLGTVAYELLTGRHPFAADSTVETMHRVLHDAPDPPSRVNPALTPEFDFVFAKVLTKDPGRRHSSAHDLDIDLETVECGCVSDAPARPETASGPRAIAVLPFKNIGGSQDLNYLGVGLADAVITRLMDSPDLVVRSTGSIAVYENRPVEPRRVGQELDVSAVLDASFQRFGDRFRATARLVETPSGRGLWAGKVDLRFEDIFEVQDQVAQGIAEALTARLGSAREAKPSANAPKGFTPSPEAYDLFLRGTEAHREATRGGFLRAIRAFERAVEIEPRYVEAWARLGLSRQSMVDAGFDSDPAWYERAAAALDRARSLDPEDPTVNFGLGSLHLVAGRKREAYQSFLATKRRAPNLSVVYHFFGYLFRLCDMLEEAKEAVQLSVALDPSAVWGYTHMVRMFLLQEDLPAARRWLEQGRMHFPGHSRFLGLESFILTAEGRHIEALRVQEQLATTEATGGVGTHARALAHLRLGERDRVRTLVPLAEAYACVDMDAAADFAGLMAQLGEIDKAFRFLDRAVDLGFDTLTGLKSDLFRPLHDDPRWIPFIAAMEQRIESYRREFHWPLPD
jgi:serine/threonine protein kinase/tetratricopeptide (TPR) repeat protein